MLIAFAIMTLAGLIFIGMMLIDSLSKIFIWFCAISTVGMCWYISYVLLVEEKEKTLEKYCY